MTREQAVEALSSIREERTKLHMPDPRTYIEWLEGTLHEHGFTPAQIRAYFRGQPIRVEGGEYVRYRH